MVLVVLVVLVMVLVVLVVLVMVLVVLVVLVMVLVVMATFRCIFLPLGRLLQSFCSHTHPMPIFHPIIRDAARIFQTGTDMRAGIYPQM